MKIYRWSVNWLQQPYQTYLREDGVSLGDEPTPDQLEGHEIEDVADPANHTGIAAADALRQVRAAERRKARRR